MKIRPSKTLKKILFFVSVFFHYLTYALLFNPQRNKVGFQLTVASKILFSKRPEREEREEKRIFNTPNHKRKPKTHTSNWRNTSASAGV